jgi:hypothetical protein
MSKQTVAPQNGISRARSQHAALEVQDLREPRLEARSSMPPATFQALVDSWADLLVADYEALEAASGAYHPDPKGDR